LGDFLRTRRKDDDKMEFDKTIILHDVTADTVDTSFQTHSKSETNRIKKQGNNQTRPLLEPLKLEMENQLPKIKFAKEARSMSPMDGKKHSLLNNESII
jgi:hypothetical protein